VVVLLASARPVEMQSRCSGLRVCGSVGLRCGNKQTYRFSVSERRRSGLRPFVIIQFNTILLTFGGLFLQMGMRPRTVRLLPRSLSAQSVRLIAVAHCGLRLTNSLNAWRTHTHTHIFEKLIVPHSVKKFLAFYETRSFITSCTTASDLSLCCTKCVAMNPKLGLSPPPLRVLTSCRIQSDCNIRPPPVGRCVPAFTASVPLQYYKLIVSSQCALHTPPISYSLIWCKCCGM